MCFRVRRMLRSHKPLWCTEHEDFTLYLFSPENPYVIHTHTRIHTHAYTHTHTDTQHGRYDEGSCVCRCRVWCKGLISHRMFDHVVLVFIFLNCITISLERPDILPHSTVTHTHS